MQQKPSLRLVILENLVWFAGSLALGFVVWLIATSQSDPVQQRTFPGIPVQATPDDNLLITEISTRSAAVTVGGQTSALNALTPDSDIAVRADLVGLRAGTHQVELQADIALRQGRAIMIRPRQITVTLEDVEERQVPIQPDVIEEPPMGYERGEVTFDVSLNQVLVSGPSSKVAQVVAAEVDLDLSEQRNPFQEEVQAIPVDASGNAINNVTVEPAMVNVSVEIRQRSDVREVRVTPNILVETLPQGYVLNSISYEPQVVSVSGAPDQLTNIPGTFFTAPIDLTNHTGDFEISVPVQVPQGDLAVISGQTIRVSVGITSLTATRQFDSIPVEITGLEQEYTAHPVPGQVTVLVNGPQILLNDLTPDDVQVSVDLNGLEEGNYQLTPTASIGQGDIPSSSISVLPAALDIQIIPASEADETSEDR